MTGVARVYRWEVAKLLAQKRTFLGLGAAIAVPIIFVVVLLLQRGGPNDVPLGLSILGVATFWQYRPGAFLLISSLFASAILKLRKAECVDAYQLERRHQWPM